MRVMNEAERALVEAHLGWSKPFCGVISRRNRRPPAWNTTIFSR